MRLRPAGGGAPIVRPFGAEHLAVHGCSDDLGDMLRRDRRLSGRTGAIAKQAIHALMHEPFLPAPHAGLGLRRRGHDGQGAKALAAQKTIRVRQMCLCGSSDQWRWRSSADARRNPVKEMSLQMRQTRMPSCPKESQIGLFRSDHSTRIEAGHSLNVDDHSKKRMIATRPR